MKIEFDPAKNATNIRDRALAFEQADEFDFSTAVVNEDVRHQYSEQRFVAVGYLASRLHVLCFALISGGIRVISFRKANSREGKNHEKPPIYKPLIDADGEVRELTVEDFARMRPASEVLPEIFPAALAAEMLKPKGRGLGKKTAKMVTTLRLPAETLMRWKATGPGWQTRMAEVLENAIM